MSYIQPHRDPDPDHDNYIPGWNFIAFAVLALLSLWALATRFGWLALPLMVLAYSLVIP